MGSGDSKLFTKPGAHTKGVFFKIKLNFLYQITHK